jgi:hypothetical protein
VDDADEEPWIVKEERELSVEAPEEGALVWAWEMVVRERRRERVRGMRRHRRVDATEKEEHRRAADATRGTGEEIHWLEANATSERFFRRS